MLDELSLSTGALRSTTSILISSSSSNHHFVGAPIDVSPSSILKSVIIANQFCNAPKINDIKSSVKRRNNTTIKKKSVKWGLIKRYDPQNNQNDIDGMWYNQHELKAFKEERRKVVQAIKIVRGDLRALEGTEYVTRGFECYQSIKFNRTIRNQRKVVIESVLRLQDKQRLSLGVINPEQIASACIRHSNWARFWATDIGMKDSIFVVEQQQQFLSTTTTGAAIIRKDSLDSFGKRLVKE
mmetsp:Transcript_36761/g.41909  ORF Transcript_36761/g.41909 Transcript_36761/m.41909 type:complete len:240 (+) Transcript_36761:39-758(+)